MDDELTRRVGQLERGNRLLFCLLIGITVSFATILLTGATRRIPERLVARSIEVVGEAGKNTASLATTRDGWVVLSFRDLEGEQKATLTMTPSGKPALTFFSKQHARLDIGVVNGQNGEEFSVQLRDASGKRIWQPAITNAY